jgi:hypothetical protein
VNPCIEDTSGIMNLVAAAIGYLFEINNFFNKMQEFISNK